MLLSGVLFPATPYMEMLAMERTLNHQWCVGVDLHKGKRAADIGRFHRNALGHLISITSCVL